MAMVDERPAGRVVTRDGWQAARVKEKPHRMPGGAFYEATTNNHASVQDDRLVHQAVELAEEFIDLLERRLFLDQLLHVFAKTRCHRAVDEDLALSVLVDDLKAAGQHGSMISLGCKFNDAVVRAVVDHLHGDTP
jgi:hypothetical protein